MLRKEFPSEYEKAQKNDAYEYRIDPNTGKHIVIKNNQLFDNPNPINGATWKNTETGFDFTYKNIV